MKPLYSYFLALCATLLLCTTANAQFTEDFEGLTDGDDSFILDGKTFTSSNADFDVTTFPDAGAGGSDKFMDNIGITTTGASYSITTGGLAFTMQSLDMYVSDSATGDNPTDGQSVEFVGKLGGATVFTYTKVAGFPTDFSVNEGFFELDFSTEPGTDYSIENIDELQITLQGTLQYVALDDFIIDSEILSTDPPEVQSITVDGTPNSTATSVDFLVTFNEAAVNVTLDDFMLDTNGTFGNLASISGSDASYTITVDNISGEGTISVDLSGSNDIEDGDGNTPSPAFTAGEDHVVTRCFQETFESFIDGDFVFASNGVNFNSGATNAFSVEFFSGGGSGGSDQCLSNDDDLGTGKIYSVATTGGETFNVEAADFYASSDDGANPTDDGTLTLRGKLLGADQFTITKSTGFPTDFSGNNGWFTVDFATDGAADYSLTNIDELEIEIGGAFTYIGLDNFEHCEGVAAADPPIVQSIDLVGDPEANASSVDFTVIFNENANNVSTDDFSLTLTGSAAGTINSVSGSGNTFTVNINGISGEGSLRLDLLPGTDIADDSANTPPDAFTDGEVHIVSPCNVESFEALAVDANTWTRGGIPFQTSNTTFSVDEFIGAGAGNSDRYLDNIDNQGTDQVNNIVITNDSSIFMESIEMFSSSELNGANPTDDGTITINGFLDASLQYTITKSSGFPTSLSTNNGFYLIDFATDGSSDFTTIPVDAIQISYSGSFSYLAVDNFKFCDDDVAPIAVCQDISVDLDAMGMVSVAPADVDGGSSDNAARFYLGLETTEFETVITSAGDVGTYGGASYFLNEFAFQVPVTAAYTPTTSGTSASGTNVIVFFSQKPDLSSPNLFDEPGFIGFVDFDNDGGVISTVPGPTFNFEVGETYFMHTLHGSPSVEGTLMASFDQTIISETAKKYDCADIGDNVETLYAFDDAGLSDSCTTTIDVNGRLTVWSGSWDNGVPDLGANVLFASDYNSGLDGGSVEACSCALANSTVTITSGDYLLTTEDIIIGTTANLVVEHEGSVVQTSETATTINDGGLSVQKTTPDLALRDFMVIGSPVTAQTDVGFFDPASVRMFSHNTSNFVPNTDVATAFPLAENFADDNGDNWSPYTGVFNAAEGYMFRRRGVDPGPSGIFSIDFNTGTLNSGSTTIPAVFNSNQNSSPNIISNPYASAIDADLFINQNSAIVSTLYFWEHITAPSAAYPGYNPINYDMGDISQYTTGSGGVAAANGGAVPTQFISSAQGFGYKAATAGIITFNNAMRVTGPNNTFRSVEVAARDRIWLNVRNEAYNLGSQTLIAFVDGATEGVEPHYDAKRLATPVSLYSSLETGEELGINGLPRWQEEAEVNLGFTSMVEEMTVFTISLADIEYNLMPEGVNVYLIDNELNVQTNLSRENYSFNSNAGSFEDRFTVVFSERTLATDDNQLTTVGLYPNPASDIVTLSTPQGMILEKVTVFDIRGRQVMQHAFDANNASFNVSNLEAAIYILQVQTDQGEYSLRLIKD